MYRFFKRNREAVKRYLLIFFLGIVSLGMVITLAPISGGDSTNTMQPNVLATIDNNNITTQDLQRLVQSQLRGSQYGFNPQIMAALAPGALDQIVLRQALQNQAHKLGMEVTDQEMLKALQGIPWLYNNGQFIGMDAYQNQVVQQTGMTSNQFEQQIRERLLTDKVRAVVTDDVTITPAEVHQEFQKRNAKAKVEYVVADPSKFLDKVKVTPEALQAFFNNDPKKYTVPQQRQVRYALVDTDRVRAEVKLDEDALRNYYSQHMADYRVPDRVKVEHILFKFQNPSGNNSAEVPDLEKKAQADLAQLKSGANFADLARKDSQDTGSAQRGGDIGWIIKGQTVKEFEDAAFSMKPGELRIVKTMYGIHIIKIDERQTAHLQTFDEMKNQIRADLEKTRLADAQQVLGDQLAREARARLNDFDAVAKKLGLEPKETGLFRYNQPVPDFGTSEAFANLSFQLRQNEVGDPISVPKGLAVIQLVEIVGEHTPALAEVKAQVEQDYRAAQSKVLAEQAAKEIADKSKAAGDLKKLAAAEGLTFKESNDFGQQDTVGDNIPGSALAAAFTLNPGQTGDPASFGGNYVVFKVVSHTPANEADFATQQGSIAEELLDRKRNMAFEIYQHNLKQQLIASGKLKMNEAGMKQFLQTFQRRGF
jgi:peptidyl-prolyl cis-trans isomerase D